MRNLDSYDIFQHTKSLKELSVDKSDNTSKKDLSTTSEKIQEFMTESTIPAVDFDRVKELFQQNLGLSANGHARSVDALLQVQNRIFFIEFKNGNMQNEKRQVREKLRDSLLIYNELTQTTVADTRKNAEFILVYNERKNPLPNQYTKNGTQPSRSRDLITKKIAQLGKIEIVLWELGKFKTLYFKDVHTYSQEEFEDFLKKAADKICIPV